MRSIRNGSSCSHVIVLFVVLLFLHSVLLFRVHGCIVRRPKRQNKRMCGKKVAAAVGAVWETGSSEGEDVCPNVAIRSLDLRSSLCLIMLLIEGQAFLLPSDLHNCVTRHTLCLHICVIRKGKNIPQLAFAIPRMTCFNCSRSSSCLCPFDH